MKKTAFCAAAAAILILATQAQAGVIEGTTGQFMSPFTSDGVTAGWVTKSIAVKSSGQIAGAAGSYAASKALENVPFAGMFGKQLGEAAGRQVALRAIGGEAFLKSSSDQSFNSLEDMAEYIKDNYIDRQDIGQIMTATYAIYPQLQPVYDSMGRKIVLNTPIKSVTGAPNAGGMVADLYKVNTPSAQTVSILVECDEMEPLVYITKKGKSRPVASAQASKGTRTVTFDAALPEAGDYVITVTPVPKMFGGAKGGAYTLTVKSGAQVASIDTVQQVRQ